MEPCRVCLYALKSDELFSIHENVSININMSASEIIWICCNIHIDINDNKSQFICGQCLENAKVAYNFRATCEDSQKILEASFKVEAKEAEEENNEIILSDVKKPKCFDTILNDNAPTEGIGIQGKNVKKCKIEQVLLSENVCPKSNSFLVKETAHYDEHLLLRKAREKCTGRNKCPDCNKFFLRASNLMPHWVNKHGRHRKQNEEQPRTNICEICGAILTDRSNLLKHINIHTREKLFTCLQCNKVFTQSAALFCHMRTNHGDRDFVCEQCGAAFKLKTRLMNHMRSHLNARDYKCKNCEKDFNTPAALREHVRIVHQGIRRHVCEICNRHFGKGYTLKTHMRVHTKEKPYICHICSQAFSQNVSLRTHLKKHVGNDIIL